MTDNRKYFGTDGVRGEVGQEPMTPQWVMKLAWAVGKMLNEQGYGGEKVIVGKDTRISGYLLEYAIVSGLSAAGMDTHLLGVMPTPGIAYFTRTFHAAAGIVISASHNPYRDNGIKVFTRGGNKLNDAAEHAIESYLEQPMNLVLPAELGKAYRVSGARERYIEFCKNAIPIGLPFERLKIVLDCANGATYAIAPDVFRELGAKVITIHDHPDGCNINRESGSTHPQALQARVRAEQADVGIAFDGDGDRVIMVDEHGNLVDGDQILYVLTKYRTHLGKKPRDVVGTVMTNLGLEKALAKMDIVLHRANVGDRYVLEKLNELDACMGGENSGHIICLDHNSTGDGIIAALQVLAAMLDMQQSLCALTADLKMTAQIMESVRIEHRESVMQADAVQQALSRAEARVAGCGRILVRPSGTEPKVRVMAEGEDGELMRSVVKELVAIIQQEDQYA